MKSVIRIAALAASLMMIWASIITSQAQSGVAPILVVVNDNGPSPFGRYLGEILRAEGISSFDMIDISSMTAGELASRQVVILGQTGLDSAQATLLTDYVNNNGNLIAMRPDAQIASLFAVGGASGTQTDGYLKIDSSATINGTAPGTGLATATLQIHGDSDLRGLQGGGVMLAQLYSDASTVTVYPAVASNASGSAVAFLYDLSTNVMMTRQGNPANGNMDVDGDGFRRTTDLFAAPEGEDTWVDKDRIHIPQADEQQRLFARLVQQAMSKSMPLPQLWYFPDSEKTVLIATGDAHANPLHYFQELIDNWVNGANGRISVYLEPWGELPISDAQMQTWIAQGHEFGLHPNADPPTTGQSLDDSFVIVQNWWDNTKAYSSSPSRTTRFHRVAWTGWTDAAVVAVQHGMALDTNFYHYGDWLQKADGTWPHGYITGSGQAMKFITADGTILPYYQLLTQLVDEHFFSAITWGGFEDITYEEATIVSANLIDSSLAGDYATIMAQFHVDYATYGAVGPWIGGTLDYANSQGVPIWTAGDWLTFVETRDASQIQNIAWDDAGGLLTFDLTGPSASDFDFTMMLPATYSGRGLLYAHIDGSSQALTFETIKGQLVAFVDVSPGNHSVTITYSGGGAIPTPTNGPSPTPTHTLTPSNTPTETPTPTHTPDINIAPVAVATVQNGTLGAGGYEITVGVDDTDGPVFLDGTGSYDPDGDPEAPAYLTYQWHRNLPEGAIEVFVDPGTGLPYNAATPPGWILSLGQHLIFLTITDAEGAEDTTTIIVNIVATGPTDTPTPTPTNTPTLTHTPTHTPTHTLTPTITPSGSVLVPPVGFVATTISRSQIDLHWIDTNTTETAYVIQHSADGGLNWQTLAVLPPDSIAFSHTGLTCATTHHYGMRAVRDTDGMVSAFTPVEIAVTDPCPASAAPINPAAVALSRNQIQFSWAETAPGEVTHYHVERSDDGTTFREIVILPASTTSMVDRHLSCGQTYHYRVRSYRAEDNTFSPYSSPVVSATTNACPAPVKHTVGLYREGMWQFWDVDQITQPIISFAFGPRQHGWQPVVGDWDGDGVDGIGLYKDGVWLLRNASTAGPIDLNLMYGLREPGWQPIVGDWDGDGVDGIGLYKDGMFQLRQTASSGLPDMTFPFGQSGDGWQPVAGDWNNSGNDTVGLFKDGLWLLSNSLPARSDVAPFTFGQTQPGWRALAGDWNEDGVVTVGVYKDKLWQLRNSNDSGSPDLGYVFASGAGDWGALASYRGGLGGLTTLSQPVQPTIEPVEATATPVATMTATDEALPEVTEEVTAEVTDEPVVPDPGATATSSATLEPTAAATATLTATATQTATATMIPPSATPPPPLPTPSLTPTATPVPPETTEEPPPA